VEGSSSSRDIGERCCKSVNGWWRFPLIWMSTMLLLDLMAVKVCWYSKDLGY